MIVLITDEDCRRYKAKENDLSSYVVEMAFQLAFLKKSLAGRIIPIRTCAKDQVPLRLLALTGACITDDNIEGLLKISIDTSIRAQREKENRR